GLDGPEWDDQWTPDGWAALKDKLAAVFKTKTRAEWTEIMGDTDICFAPVMAMDEVLDHPHVAARETFVAPDGVLQPAPAPRFSRTAPEIQAPPAFAGEHNDAVLTEWGFDAATIADLKAAGALVDAG
ncbi:MAG: CoA transferase, partial [Pseudomonadota bacterium]|nr:CoA transferase [Pseudomonadota bacterium]